MPAATPKRKAPHGSWPSPLTPERVLAARTSLRHGLGQLAIDGDDVYWIEGRPHEGGRNVVVRRRPDGSLTDASPPGVSVRTRAHEYGGGDFTVSGSLLYYVDDANQGVFVLDLRGGAPRQLTPLQTAGEDRYADFVVDHERRRLVAVRECHRPKAEPVNELVAIDADGRGVEVMARGADFYASPAVATDALAWLQWNHPNMPWDGCELRLASLDAAGHPTQARTIAGGPAESIFQPSWDEDGRLYLVSDRSGWAQPYRWQDGGPHRLCERKAEFAAPQWVFGTSTYGFDGEGSLVCAFTEGGTWKLGRLDPARDDLVEIAQPYTDIAHVRVAGGRVFFRGGSPDRATEVVALDLADGTIERLLPPVPAPVAPSGLSRPEAIRFPTSGGEYAHGFFYPPKNAEFEGEAGTQPPLIVVGHGGPTAAASTALDPKIQFWTSRGFALLDVNYRGSTGFGRAYRDALKGRWGVSDVDDCVAGARHLVDRGLVDGTRLAIRGSSAGGFTVLCAITFHDVFRAAACYYGISDLEALARDTHKFEAHYTDTLVGPYPEQIDLYRARSPIHHVGRLSCPLIVLQGLRDKVVPPSQAEAIVDAVRAKGLPVAYVTFADEGHGFRNADNGRRALEAELAFYAEIFGFVPADELPGLAIENA